MDKDDFKKIPVEIIIPLLEAAPIVYGLVTDFMAMLAKTKATIDSWDDKTKEEQQMILEATSMNFDESMDRFQEALAAVKAK